LIRLPKLKVIEGVFVGFESDILEGMTRSIAALRLGILPCSRIDRLLNSGLKSNVEVVCDLHEDIFPVASVLPVLVNHSVGSWP
jgi:hypothetical protein